MIRQTNTVSTETGQALPNSLHFTDHSLHLLSALQRYNLWCLIVQLYSKKARSQTKFFKHRHGVLEFVMFSYICPSFSDFFAFSLITLELQLP